MESEANEDISNNHSSCNMQAQIKRKVNGDGASKFAKEENQLVLRDFLLLLLLPLSTLLSVGVSVESGTAVAVRYPPNPAPLPLISPHWTTSLVMQMEMMASPQRNITFTSLFWGVG